MRNLKAIAAGVSLALAMGANVANADITAFKPAAVGDALLAISAFQLTEIDPTTGAPIGPAADVLVDPSATVNGNATATLNGNFLGDGGAPIDPLNGDSFEYIATNPGAFAYTPKTTLPMGTVGATSFAVGYSMHTGSGLDPVNPTVADTHAQVNLRSNGSSGFATSNQLLSSQFEVTAAKNATISVSFFAEQFLRAALGQPSEQAQATSTWKLTLDIQVAPNAFVPILSWEPNGTDGLTAIALGGPGTDCKTLGFCGVITEAFDINNGVLLENGTVDDNVVSESGDFGLFAALLAGETYRFGIDHVTQASAQIVPEPGVLALLGVGSLMVGVGASRKRKA